MGYVSYDYYRNTFSGKVISDCGEFTSAEVEASAYIDRLTRGRASKNLSDSVRNAICAVAEVIAKQAHDETPTISGESVGNHSKSFSKVNVSPADREAEKYRKAVLFLSRTGLLYRGLT